MGAHMSNVTGTMLSCIKVVSELAGHFEGYIGCITAKFYRDYRTLLFPVQ